MSKANDEVLKTISRLINEVKNDLNNKKVLVENKQPEQIFEQHKKQIEEYIKENVTEAIIQSLR